MAKPKKDSPIGTYPVLSPIQDGDTRYEPGDSYDTTEDAAAELIGCGALAPLKAKADKQA